MRWFFSLLFLAAFSISSAAQPLPPGTQPSQLHQFDPEIMLKTSFAHDYGTLLDAVVYRGVEYSPSEAAEKILPLLNWKTREDRLELGQAWIESIALFNSEVIRPGNTRHPGLDGPQAIILPDGTVRYTAWASWSAGRTPGATRTLWQIDINPEGRVTKTSLEDVDLHQLPVPKPD